MESALWGWPVPAPSQPSEQERNRGSLGRQAGSQTGPTTTTPACPFGSPQPQFPAWEPLTACAIPKGRNRPGRNQRLKNAVSCPLMALRQTRWHDIVSHRLATQHRRLACWFVLSFHGNWPLALTPRILRHSDFRV